MPNLCHFLKLILLSLLLLCRNNSYAQITGKITSNKEPLPFANVLLLKSADSTLIKGAVSDANGEFYISSHTAGKFLLKSSSIGYQDSFQEISLIENSPINLGPIHLSENSERLDEVVIEATKPLFEQKIDRTVINVQSSITSSAGSALDVLEKSPGVTIDRANNSLSLAGKQGVRIMLNGKMSRMPLSAAVQMLNGINAENVESIELITTPPAKYEAEGDAGIINIVLKQSAEAGTNGSFSIFTGYGQQWKYGGTLNFNHRKNKFNVFGNYSYRNNHTKQQFNNDRTLEMDNNITNRTLTESDRDPTTVTHNAQLGFDYQIGKNTIVGLQGSYFDTNWTMNALNDINITNNEVPSSFTNLYIDEINHWKYYVINTSISQEFGDNQNLTLEFDYIGYDSNNPTNYFQDFTDISGTNDGDSTSLFRSGKITPLYALVPRIDYSNKINNNTTFEAGAKMVLNNLENDISVESLQSDGSWQINPEISSLAYLKENIYALYSSIKFKASDKLSASIGLRYEHTITDMDTDTEQNVVYRNYGNLFPSIFLNKKINDDNSWVISYSRRITRPTFQDIAPFVIFMDLNSYYTGNAALLPAITDGVKFEFRHKTYLFNVQYSRDKNAIARYQPSIAPDGITQVGSSQNMDYRDNLSFTTTLSFNVTEWWEMQYNLTAAYTITETSHLETPQRFEIFSASASGSNTFILPKKFTFEISGFYRAPRYFGIAYMKTMGALNFGLEKKFKNDNGSLRLTFTDTFNTRNLHFTTDIPDENLNIDLDLFLESQILNLTYTQNFGNNKLKKMRNKGAGSRDEQNRIGG